MNLIWKLLRQHISIAQLLGFVLANLCGVFIILLGLQFYRDIAPVFKDNTLNKKEYLILSKPVSTLGSVLGGKSGFSQKEIDNLKMQGFTKSVGPFKSSQFQVVGGIGAEQFGVSMATEMFFESVPDAYVDVKSKDWTYMEGSRSIPIILPKNYLNLYNFGFAKTKNLPQLTEQVIKMLSLNIRIRGNGRSDEYKGRIVGFSNRLNTILVPESFLDWANNLYAPQKSALPSRLILEVNNPSDARIVKFLQDKRYETEGDHLDGGKMTWFLRILVSIVMGIGLIISVLSFFLLILSIYLLLQKNTQKLENLLLIGYTPAKVALPYQILTIFLNCLVISLSVLTVLLVRNIYVNYLSGTFPVVGNEGITWMLVAAIVLFLFVSILNTLIIRRKVLDIWFKKN